MKPTVNTIKDESLPYLKLANNPSISFETPIGATNVAEIEFHNQSDHVSFKLSATL